MTVNELHQICNNLMFEQNSNTDYQFAFINVLNLVLAENFTANNVLRKQKGLEMFETIPAVASFDDVLSYEERLLKNVIPYGCCYWLYLEDDASIADRYKLQYDMAKQTLNNAVYVDIEDYYGD